MEEKTGSKGLSLCRRAETAVNRKYLDVPENLTDLSADDGQRILHELRIHQVELEMQNERLAQTQLALEASWESYFNLYNLAPFGYLTLDEQKQIQGVNLTGANLLGLEISNLVKLKLTNFIVNEDQDVFYLYHNQLDTNQAQKSCEIRLVKKDGSWFWAQVEMTKGQDSERGTIVYRTVIMDITERKEAEELLKNIRHELEHRVKERTQELEEANKKLLLEITERKKVEQELFKAEKLKSISILAGGIAHDFNNYLTILMGNISMAMRHINNPEKAYGFLEQMKQATLQTKKITSQFFVFAKGSEPIKEVANIKHLIIENTDFALSGSNVRCHFSFPEDLQMVEIDIGQITQVLYNIVINAVQAMPDGGTIWVKAENVNLKRAKNDVLSLPSGDYIKVSVKDEGPGIPEENLEKVFDPFFTTKKQGSGLGLAGSYSIIKKHNGFIKAESKVGKGTTLSFLIPATTQIESSNLDEDQIIHGTGKILLMDDEAAIREVVGQMVTSMGYEVQSVREGSEAIKVYMEAKKLGLPFDLIIMDLTIKGGLGGKETIKELLKIDPEAKAVIASGYSEDLLMAKFNEYGFRGVVEKPFSVAELSKVINDVLE